jgi:hypothetical protein
MARVTYAEVDEIVSSSLDSGTIEALIDDASHWVDAHLVGKGLSDTTLAAVEKYLAAHLVKRVDEGGEGQLLESKRGDVSERYAEQKDASGSETSYLRTAAAFDRTGTVGEHWLGRKRMKFRVGDGYGFDGVTG